ncbi:MAG: accessory gene regulator B family protein [Ruminococcus flavefaciens]|nr:accessory gene regulator B family protein [Ruminococcus flavefaciens]
MKKLEHNNAELNKTESQEICAYGIEITLSTIVNYVLLLAIGLVFKSVISAVIFGIVFTTIRHYIGGYHCTTYLRCNLTFCGIFVSVLLLGQILLNWVNISILILILLWSGLGVWYLGPVENKYKPVTEVQLQQCHTIAKYIYIADFAVSVFLYLWKPYYGIITALTLLSVVVLLPIGTIAERRSNNES